jgi:hypothetical protein
MTKQQHQTIRAAVLAELTRRGWSRYKLVKQLRGVVPATVIYEYLAGKRDITSARVDFLLQELQLQITAD